MNRLRACTAASSAWDRKVATRNRWVLQSTIYNYSRGRRSSSTTRPFLEFLDNNGANFSRFHRRPCETDAQQ